MRRSNVQSYRLRAGAFGTLHGGHPGLAGVGLSVPIATCLELRLVREILAGARVQATLLIPPELGRSCADLITEVAQAGHEVAGSGLLPDFTHLEALSAQQVRVWWVPQAAQFGPLLRRLQQAGISPLPEATTRPTPGAILHVLPATLEQTIGEIKALGYKPQPVSGLPDLRAGRPRDLFEYLYQRAVEEPYQRREGMLDLSRRFDAVLRVAPLDHAPHPLPLPRQTPTAELHVNSLRLVGLASGNLLATYKAFQRSLKDVAAALETHPELRGAQAVFAVTLFHGPLEKAGFTVLDLPPLRARWYGLGFRLLRAAYGTTRTPSEGTPKMAWMTREAFLQRYGEKKRMADS